MQHANRALRLRSLTKLMIFWGITNTKDTVSLSLLGIYASKQTAKFLAGIS